MMGTQVNSGGVVQCQNFVGGRWKTGTGNQVEVFSPYTGKVIGQFKLSKQTDIDEAVDVASKAQLSWGRLSLKERCQVMFKFRQELLDHADEIAQTASSECGKTVAEAKAGLMKGVEVLEFALSLQNLDLGSKMEVSRDVFCEYRREPVGVVAGITPFNFPAMVPMWMIPIAITLGNSFVWKPSDKTPLTSILLAEAIQRAGVPDGVLTVVQGDKNAVDALIKHPKIGAIGFVGSTPVAKSIYQKGCGEGKRVLALGGAKNHIILMPDADVEIASRGIADSFTGCAGQRCMAASVLVAVGKSDHIVQEVVKKAQAIQVGKEMGAIITAESRDRLKNAVDKAGQSGAEVLLDGRSVEPPKSFDGGYWFGPTVLDNVQKNSSAASEELFGPVLSIVRAENLEEALEIENSNAFGNAASIFTTSGASAEMVAQRARAGMVGVNIGVPVPREPFSFGGFYDSKFGHGDITGPSSLDFWSSLKKVTSKWTLPKDKNWMN